MLAIELTVHQHVVDVNEVLSRVEQILDDLQTTLPSTYGTSVQDNRNRIADQMDSRPLIRVLIALLFRPDNLVLANRTVASERVSVGNVDGDDTGSEKLIRLRYLA